MSGMSPETPPQGEHPRAHSAAKEPRAGVSILRCCGSRRVSLPCPGLWVSRPAAGQPPARGKARTGGLTSQTQIVSGVIWPWGRLMFGQETASEASLLLTFPRFIPAALRVLHTLSPGPRSLQPDSVQPTRPMRGQSPGPPAPPVSTMSWCVHCQACEHSPMPGRPAQGLRLPKCQGSHSRPPQCPPDKPGSGWQAISHQMPEQHLLPGEVLKT